MPDPEEILRRALASRKQNQQRKTYSDAELSALRTVPRQRADIANRWQAADRGMAREARNPRAAESTRPQPQNIRIDNKRVAPRPTEASEMRRARQMERASKPKSAGEVVGDILSGPGTMISEVTGGWLPADRVIDPLIRGAARGAQGIAETVGTATKYMNPSMPLNNPIFDELSDFLGNIAKGAGVNENVQAFNADAVRRSENRAPITGNQFADNVLHGAGGYMDAAANDPLGALGAFADMSIEQIPQMIALARAGKLLNGAGKFANTLPSMFMETGNAFVDAHHNEQGQRTAGTAHGDLAAFVGGVAAGKLEDIGIGKAFGNAGEVLGETALQRAINTATAGGTEMMTEMTQEAIGDTAGVIGGYKKADDAGKTVFQAGIGGLGAGAGIRGARESAQALNPRRAMPADAAMRFDNAIQTLQTAYDPTGEKGMNVPADRKSRNKSVANETYTAPNNYRVEVHHEGGQFRVFDDKGKEILRPQNHVGAVDAIAAFAARIDDENAAFDAVLENGDAQNMTPSSLEENVMSSPEAAEVAPILPPTTKNATPIGEPAPEIGVNLGGNEAVNVQTVNVAPQTLVTRTPIIPEPQAQPQPQTQTPIIPPPRKLAEQVSHVQEIASSERELEPEEGQLEGEFDETLAVQATNPLQIAGRWRQLQSGTSQSNSVIAEYFDEGGRIDPSEYSRTYAKSRDDKPNKAYFKRGARSIDLVAEELGVSVDELVDFVEETQQGDDLPSRLARRFQEVTGGVKLTDKLAKRLFPEAKKNDDFNFSDDVPFSVGKFNEDEGQALNMQDEAAKMQKNIEAKKVIGDLYDEAIADNTDVEKIVRFQEADDRLVRAVKTELDIDISGFKHSISSGSIRHIHKKHGQTKENLRGQKSITKTDVEKIPDILDSPDKVYYAGTDNAQNLHTLVYEKEDAGKYYYVEVVYKGKKRLATKTLFKSNSQSSGVLRAMNIENAKVLIDNTQANSASRAAQTSATDTRNKTNTPHTLKSSNEGNAESGIPAVNQREADAPPQNTYHAPNGAWMQMGGLDTLSPVELPEMYRLFIGLGFEVHIENLDSDLNGFFKVKNGSITLNAKLFKEKRLDKLQAAKTFAHEIGHWVDWLGKDADTNKTMSKGNILGRLKSLHGFVKTSVEIATSRTDALSTDARRMIRNEAMREALAENGVTLSQWIQNKKDLHEAVVERVKARVKELSQQKAKEKAKYAGMVTKAEIMQELIALSEYWRPYSKATSSPKFIRYRESSKEVYADFISVLLNSPKDAAEKAPKAFKVFMLNLSEKPDIEAAYIEIQNAIQSDQAKRLTREGVQKGFERGVKQVLEAKDKENSWREYVKRVRSAGLSIAELVHDKSARLQKVERDSQKADRTGKRAKTALEGFTSAKKAIDGIAQGDVKLAFSELAYGNAVTHLVDMTFQQDIIERLEKQGLTIEQAGEFMVYNRIANEEYETAESRERVSAALEAAEKAGTPLSADEIEAMREFAGQKYRAGTQGITPKRALELMDNMRQELGDEKYDFLVDRVRAFQDMMYQMNEEAVDAGIISEAAFEHVIKPTRYTYSANRVIDFIDASEYMPATIKEAQGSFREIDNPLMATYLKLQAVNKLIQVQRAKQAAVKVLHKQLVETDENGNELPNIEKAERAREKTYKRPPMKWGQFTLLEGGKMVAYNVRDKYIADFLNSVRYDDNQAIQALTIVVGAATWLDGKVFKKLWLNYNAGFAVMNPIRDVTGTLKRVPGFGRPDNMAMFLYYFGKAIFTEARKYTTGKESTLLREMFADSALLPPENSLYGKGTEFRYSATEKYYLSHDGKEKMRTALKWTSNILFFPFKAVEKFGQLTEASSKIAAYQTLGKMGIEGRKRAFVVREMAGTPNFMRRGQFTSVSNQAATFSNIMIQSLATEKALATNPSTMAGYWFKSAILLAPKLMMIAAIGGAAGEELKKMYEMIGSYDLRNYICIPIGWSDGEGDFGKRVEYLRLPMDEQSRFWGAMLYSLHSGDNTWEAYTKSFGAVGDLVPNISPSINIMTKWSEFMNGKQPEDSFYGKPIIKDNTMKAMQTGDKPAVWRGMKEMLYWSIEQTGAWKFGQYDDQNKTWYEGTFSDPLAQRFAPIWKFVKTSDSGARERQRKAEKKEEGSAALLKMEYGDKVQRLNSLMSNLQKLGDKRTPRQQKQHEFLNAPDLDIKGMPSILRKRRGFADEYRALTKEIKATKDAKKRSSLVDSLQAVGAKAWDEAQKLK